MNTEDERNLEAYVLAIARNGKQLSPALHSKIQAAGYQLAQDESAIDKLLDLIEKDSNFSRSYEQAREELQAKYEDDRERSKSGASAIPNGHGLNGNGSFVRSLAIPILTADNFTSVAQRLVTQPDWQTQVKQASEDVQTFFRTLKDAVTSLDPLSIQLLKILDKDIFAIDSLAYRVYLTEEAIKPALEELWRRSYIYPVSNTVTGNIWRSLNIFTRNDRPLNTDSYLSLTAKGYYHLHPHPLYKAVRAAKGK